MFPNQTVGDNGMPCELTMDGQPLRGVTSLNVKAGSNGFTNVAIEFESSCAVQFAGHLIATTTGIGDEEQALLLASLYRDAKAEVDSFLDAEGEDLDANYMAQADLVRRIIELGIERIK